MYICIYACVVCERESVYIICKCEGWSHQNIPHMAAYAYVDKYIWMRCVCERERERESVCVCVCTFMSVCIHEARKCTKLRFLDLGICNTHTHTRTHTHTHTHTHTQALGEKIGGFIAPMAKSVNPEGIWFFFLIFLFLISRRWPSRWTPKVICHY